MEQKEIWKDIPEYEGMYQVSNLGNVKSLKGKLELILKKQNNSYGYFHVSLVKNGKSKTRTIHQLIALSFLDYKNYKDGFVVNHKDFNRKNNNLSNLEIVTIRENCNQKHLDSISKYTGVNWSKRHKKWMSRISLNGKRKYLGCFDSEYEAHLKYENELNKLYANL